MFGVAPLLRTSTLLLASLCCGLPAQDGPATPALDGMIEQKDGVFRFPKVKAWKCVQFETAPIDAQLNAAFEAWSFVARTFQYGNIDVAFVLLNGARPTPRLQAIYDRYGKMGPEEIEPGDYRIGLEPVVHAIYPINDERTDLIVYLPANGRMLSLRFTVDTPKLQKALPVLLDLAAHVEVDLPTWPPLPDGYDYEDESGLQIAFSSAVSKKRRKQIHKFVREVKKDFTKAHAAPQLNAGAPVVLFVSDDMGSNARLVGADQGYNADFSLGMRRVVTITVHPEDPDTSASCRAMLWRYFAWTLYPEHRCMWLHWGMRDLASNEGWCGKGLPTTPAREVPKLAGVTKRLEQVSAASARVSLDEAASWVAYFRLGPTKHKKAYAQLLKDLRTGVDPDAKVAAFVGAFDQVELQADARKLLRKKLKPAKAR